MPKPTCWESVQDPFCSALHCSTSVPDEFCWCIRGDAAKLGIVAPQAAVGYIHRQFEADIEINLLLSA